MLTSLLTARLFVELARAVTEESIIDSLDMAVLGAALYVGQLEGRPMTASKIAEYIGIPRPTVIRKLAQLKKEGSAVVDSGKRWRLATEDETVHARVRSITHRQLQLIRKASTELSKLDSRKIATTTRRT